MISPVWAQDSEADWPSEIDYPPNSFYVPPQQFDAATDAVRRELNLKKPEDKTQSKAKKSWWPFGDKKSDQTPIPPTEEEIVNVGPREHPAAREPLFRLPISLKAPDGRTVQAGFYLVRPVAISETECRLQLLKEGRLLFEAPARKTTPATPLATGPVEPVTPTKPAPVMALVTAQISPDYTQLTIIWRQGNDEFRTDPLPTLLTERPTLRF